MADSVASVSNEPTSASALLQILRSGIDVESIPDDDCSSKLEQLKVISRDSSGAEFLCTDNSIEILVHYGLVRKAGESSREALRCLANVLLLHPSARQILVDQEVMPLLVGKLQSGMTDDEFLSSRILFLLTYETNLDFAPLVDACGLDEAINRILARHAESATDVFSDTVDQRPSSETMALSETLKLLFNITYHNPALLSRFDSSVTRLVSILLSEKAMSPLPLQPPVSYLINSVLNFDLERHSAQLFPSEDPTCLVQHLIQILGLAISHYPEVDLDTTAAPLLALLRKVFEFAPDIVQRLMKDKLLPSDADRIQPLGEGDSLSARLLRLSSSPRLPHLRDSISGLLFELSDKDPANFVRNVGYGYASGYLVNNNLHSPQYGITEPPSPSATGGVNFVTGQNLVDEPVVREAIPMTEEEKLMEAERLFILFERLKATGVVDVQNPVHAAAATGRLEELDEHDDDKQMMTETLGFSKSAKT